jgi:hypothetical protein
VRRRPSALGVIVATAWLAAAPALAQAPPQAPPPATTVTRHPANDPATVKAGTLFTIHGHLLSVEPDFETQETEALGGKDKRAQQLVQIQRLDADALAERYVRSLEGLIGLSLMVDVMRGIFRDPAIFQQRIELTRSLVHKPDGSTLTLPSLVAATYHRGDLRLAARTLQERKASGSVAGAYTAAVRGTECPFAAGPILLVQQGSVLEGTREGRLLLWGALGGKQGAFLATEQRFVSITRTGGQTTNIEVPDRPGELYLAALAGPALVLNGSQRRTCTITLTPASSGVK